MIWVWIAVTGIYLWMTAGFVVIYGLWKELERRDPLTW
jgi:hypothetical protein